MSRLARHDETGVAHPKRCEDASREHLTERCAIETRDQEAEEVARVAVVESSARLIDQRHCCEPCDPFVGREWIVDCRTKGLAQRAADRAAMKLGVRETR